MRTCAPGICDKCEGELHREDIGHRAGCQEVLRRRRSPGPAPSKPEAEGWCCCGRWCVCTWKRVTVEVRKTKRDYRMPRTAVLAVSKPGECSTPGLLSPLAVLVWEVLTS